MRRIDVKPTKMSLKMSRAAGTAKWTTCTRSNDGTMVLVAQKNKALKLIPLDKDRCEALEYENANQNSTRPLYGKWIKSTPHGIPAPECLGNVNQRDNHHGNVGNGQWTGFNWKVPAWMEKQNCVIRMRYNISTKDFPAWDDDSSVATGSMNASYSRGYRTKTKAAKYDIGANFGVESTKVEKGELRNSRGYVLQNNPQVSPYGPTASNFKLQLAINTAQLGRTFEDRTHVMTVEPRPDAVPASAVIHNVNVRGKRGNIVQTYPGTEYDFTPNNLKCAEGEFVHFQWTGSNTNPNNNAGQGRQGTDRSNVVGLANQVYPESTIDLVNTVGQYGNSYPNRIDQTDAFLGADKTMRETLALTGSHKFGLRSGEMSELDDGDTYFDMGPIPCSKAGRYNYLSTRNNNFSNRSQKGRITVGKSSETFFTAGQLVREQTFPGGAIKVGGLDSPVTMTVRTEPMEDVSKDSPVLSITPVTFQTSETLEVTLAFKQNPMSSPIMYHAMTAAGPWEPVQGAMVVDNGMVTMPVAEGGMYVVRNPVNGGIVFGIILLVLVIIGGIVGGVWWYKKKNGGGHSQLNN